LVIFLGYNFMTGLHQKYSRQDQLGYLTFVLISVSLLTIARLLEPSSQGVGTHEQMGLPPCLFLHLTGIPCPSCGLTTSFAYAARLDFFSSLITQPFGLIFFFLTIFAIPFSIFLIRRRISWSELLQARIVDRLIYVAIALYALSWFYKIIIWRYLK
jgi:Protein of unknown function (DUF2752)